MTFYNFVNIMTCRHMAFCSKINKTYVSNKMKGWFRVASERRKILLVSSEAAPYAKSGGLGDVVGSLPKALQEADVDVRVVLPKYATIKEEHLQDVEYLGSFSINLAWRTQEAKILRKIQALFLCTL